MVGQGCVLLCESGNKRRQCMHSEDGKQYYSFDQVFSITSGPECSIVRERAAQRERAQ